MSGTARLREAAAALGSALPIIQGGMTAIGTARLAAAVSSAGALGLVSAGGMTAAAFADEIDCALSLTDRPIGVNIPVGRDAAWMQEAIDAALARRVAAVVLGGGNPAPWAPRIVDGGKRLVIVVSHPRQAEHAQRLGAVAVVAEGNEAGGKNGLEELGGLTLVPLVARAVGIPVFAAGGIVDGRTAAAAICLGAGGVQLGTRFMLSAESPLHPATKAFLTAQPRSTMLIGRRHGLNRRSVRNAAAEEVASREHGETLAGMVELLGGGRSWRGLREGDVERGLISAGQGVALIGDAPPVAQIVRTLMQDMNAALREAAAAAGALGHDAAAANAGKEAGNELGH